MSIAFYDAVEVEELLDYPGCIEAMRQAMIALSSGERPQPLRQIFTVGDNQMFGTMPGELTALSTFGAKLVSVFGDPERPGRTRHQGVIVVYDGSTGAVSCIADAEPVTRIRTGCASAVATDVLARGNAEVLAIFGTGVQAEAHLRAVPLVRPFREILLWGRSPERTIDFAERMSSEIGRTVTAVLDGEEAARRADVICTVTSSAEPVLLGGWVSAGTHINLVGSSYLGPVEIDSALVAKARYIADYRPGVLAQAAELAVARDAGIVEDSHVVGEIGEVLAGRVRGRENANQITIYKSLGHVAQDLAAAVYLRQRTNEGREGLLSTAVSAGHRNTRFETLGHYLFVWTGDQANQGSDFLFVVDADPRSPSYGKLITSVATDQKSVRPHHTEYEMPASGMLFANDHNANRSFIFDLRDPVDPRVAATFGDMGGFAMPHSFLRLPNGHVLSSFQQRRNGNSMAAMGDMAGMDGKEMSGGIVEIDDAGKVIRAVSNADPAHPDWPLLPYSLMPLPSIDRVLVTNSPMQREYLLQSITYQMFRLSDLKLLGTYQLDRR